MKDALSIAHELGRYVLHRNADIVFVDSTLTFYRDETSADGMYRQEIDANRFAAELLMPKEFIARSLGGRKVGLHDEGAVTNLANRFKIGRQALVIRFANPNLVAT